MNLLPAHIDHLRSISPVDRSPAEYRAALAAIDMDTVHAIIHRVKCIDSAAHCGHYADIATIRKYIPNAQDTLAQIVVLIMAHYFELCDIDNLPDVNDPLHQRRIIFIAEELINQYPEFTIIDLALMIRRGITGAYGPIYGKIDIQTICGAKGWAGQYKSQDYMLRREAMWNHLAKQSSLHQAQLPHPEAKPLHRVSDDIRRDFESQYSILESRAAIQMTPKRKSS